MHMQLSQDVHRRTFTEGHRPSKSHAEGTRGSPRVCGVRELRHGVSHNGVGPPSAVSIAPQHAFRAPPQQGAYRMLTSVRGRQPWLPMAAPGCPWHTRRIPDKPVRGRQPGKPPRPSSQIRHARHDAGVRPAVADLARFRRFRLPGGNGAIVAGRAAIGGPRSDVCGVAPGVLRLPCLSDAGAACMPKRSGVLLRAVWFAALPCYGASPI